MPITSFEGIFNKVKQMRGKRLAVAGAEEGEILQAVAEAHREGIIEPILIGDGKRIRELAAQKRLDTSSFELIEEDNPQHACLRAVELVREGRADMLMKGKVGTSVLLKVVLDKEQGLRKGKLLSHVVVMEAGAYPKLLIITDGGLNISPDLETKVELIRNASLVANRLGIGTPNVALLAAVETPNPNMPETIDAAILTKMAQRGQLGNVIADGPVAFDLAVSSQVAQIKGVESPIAGEADIFLVPHIATGNIFVKALVYLGKVDVGGIVVGATAPIVLLSRADTAKIKLNSIALGALLCEEER